MAADAAKYQERSDVNVEEDDRAHSSCDDESRGDTGSLSGSDRTYDKELSGRDIDSGGAPGSEGNNFLSSSNNEEESDARVEDDDRARNSCDDESRGECRLHTPITEVDREETSCPPCEQPKVEENLLDPPSPEEESANAGATLCPRCHDHFKNPRILPCAHVMCRDCVVSLLEQLRTASCPRCNYCILDPCQDDDRRAEDIADDLNEDKATTVLVECATFLQQSHPCCVCDEQPALWVCLHCGDPMCSACVTAHQKFSFTNSHEVEELSALSPSSMAFRRRPSSYRRPGGTLEMYCRDHKVALTSHAAVREHRKCSEVTTLEDECQEVDQTLSELTVGLCTSEEAVQEALLRLERYENDEARKILNSLGEGETACDQLEKAVAERRRQFQERASRAKEKLRKVVLERRLLLKEQQGRLASHVQLTQRVKDMGACEEKVLMRQALQMQVGYSLRTCGVPQDLEGSNSPLIAVNSQLLHIMKTAIGCLGYVVLPPCLSETWEEVVNFIKNTSGKFGKDKKLLPSGQGISPLSVSRPGDPLSEILSEPESPLSEVLSESGSPLSEVPSEPKSEPESPDQVREYLSRRSSGRRTEWSPAFEDVKRLFESDHNVYTYRVVGAATDNGLPSVSHDQQSFRFHKNAGTNIMICDRNTKAKAIIPGTVGNGLILSLDPMTVGHLYEVQVKRVMSDVGSEMSVGVCFRDPDTITLPAYACNINRNTGVIISPRQCDGGGENDHNDPRRRLRDIPDGRRVGVLVDLQQWLHLYINGIDCGPLTQLDHCFFYAMFELYCGVEEVNSLPVREEH